MKGKLPIYLFIPIYLSYILLNTYGCNLLFIAERCLLRQQGKWNRETLKMLKRPYLLAEMVDDQNGQNIYQRHCMYYMSIMKMSHDHLTYCAGILIAH